MDAGQVVVAQAQVDGQVGIHFPVVLNVRFEVLLVPMAFRISAYRDPVGGQGAFVIVLQIP